MVVNTTTKLIALHTPQEGKVSLIHIPIRHYSFFLQLILRLLFGEDHDEDAAKIPWTERHQFLNISLTPIECSIFCSIELADRYFTPLADIFNALVKTKKKGDIKEFVEINPEDYVVIQVEGSGLDAGQRVLDLTSPLAMAGISIFFESTYFSDYILVPAKARRAVAQTLEQRGFVFSKSADAFVSQLSLSSPTLSHHTRQQSSSSTLEAPAPPTTPPAQSISELQSRTFARLKRNNITPTVDSSIRLLACAGHKHSDPALASQLRDDLFQVLLSTCPCAPLPPSSPSGLSTPPTPPPSFATRFLSLTLTSTDPLSVLLEHTLLPRLGTALLGSKRDDDVLIPIMLDLRELPLEAPGIVCGVAGRLAQGTAIRGSVGEVSPGPKLGNHTAGKSGGAGSGPVEISFLSTARAGTVLVKESELERALKALEEGANMREPGQPA